MHSLLARVSRSSCFIKGSVLPSLAQPSFGLGTKSFALRTHYRTLSGRIQIPSRAVAPSVVLRTNQNHRQYSADAVPKTKTAERIEADTLAAAESNEPMFTAVGRKKLLVMSIGTLGLYTIYWDYLNWKLIEKRTEGGSSVRPLFRAATSPFLSYRLFSRIIGTYQHLGLETKTVMSPMVLSLITTGCWLYPFLPIGSAPFWTLLLGDLSAMVLIALPRLMVQEYAHRVNEHVMDETEGGASKYVIDNELTLSNWLLILIILLLNFYGYYLLWEERGAKQALQHQLSNSAAAPSDTSPHTNIIGGKWPLRSFPVIPPVGTQPGNGSPPPQSPPSSPSQTPPSTPRGVRI